MPTYDYICDACGHEWELFQRITEDAIKKCPECNKKKAVRQFGTGAAVMFKGSGFYETDYRSESYKKSAAADSSSKSDSASESSTAGGDNSNASGKSEKPAAVKKTTNSKPKKKND